MTEALIPTLAALPAPPRGGAAVAARAEVAESFAAQFVRSQAAATDVMADAASLPTAATDGATDVAARRTPDRDSALDDAPPDALTDFLAQWLAGAPPCTTPTAAVAAPVTTQGNPVADRAAPPLGVSEPTPPSTVASSNLPRSADVPAPTRDGGLTPTAPTAAALRSAATSVDEAARNVGAAIPATRDRVDRTAPRRGPVLTDGELSTTATPPSVAVPDAESALNSESTPATTGPCAAAVALDAGFAGQPVAAAPPAAATPLPSTPSFAPIAASPSVETSPVAQVVASRPSAANGTSRANDERHIPSLPTRAALEPTRDVGAANARGTTPPADEPVPATRPHSGLTESIAPTAAGPAPTDTDAPAASAGNSPGVAESPAPARPPGADTAAPPSANLSTTAPVPLPASVTPPHVVGGTPPALGDLATPVQSPQFADALGVQVSVLARGGIERAELQLNPVSMGPLAVQITLDAGQAQVHFGSDSAQTRQIVEAGFPALAAALRDAGFTLSGGGVSQHPGEPRQGSPGRGATNFGLRQDAAPDDEIRPLRSTRATLGRLDLYA